MDGDEEVSPTQEIDFCTLGMLIIGKKALLYCLFTVIFVGLFL